MEVAWVFFRYTDTFHYYWISVKPNGVELGKKTVTPVQILWTDNSTWKPVKTPPKCGKMVTLESRDEWKSYQNNDRW